MDLLYYDSDEGEDDYDDKNVESLITEVTFTSNTPISENVDVSENDIFNDITEANERSDSLKRIESTESKFFTKVNQYPLLDKMLPPLIETNVNPLTFQNIKDYKERGLDLTETLRSNKQFGNPYILTKVVKTLGIDEIGSNYPLSLFDPHGYEENDFEDSVRSRYSQTLPPLSSAATEIVAGATVTSSLSSFTQRHHHYQTAAVPDIDFTSKRVVDVAAVVAGQQSSQVASKLAAAATAAAAITSSLFSRKASNKSHHASSSSSSNEKDQERHSVVQRDRSGDRFRSRDKDHDRGNGSSSSSSSNDKQGGDVWKEDKGAMSKATSSKWEASTSSNDFTHKKKRSRWDDTADTTTNNNISDSNANSRLQRR